MGKSERDVRYEVRREAASVVVIAVGLLAALAFLSWRNGWELVEIQWWFWLVLTAPGLVLCVDLWLGSRRVGFAGTRGAAIVLLVFIVMGNIVGVCLLVTALVTTKTDDLSGGQLLFTTAVIWMANVIVFGLCYWDLDDGVRSSARGTSARIRTSASPRTRRRRSLRPTGVRAVGLCVRRPDERECVQSHGHDAADAEGEAPRRAGGSRLARAHRPRDGASG